MKGKSKGDFPGGPGIRAKKGTIPGPLSQKTARINAILRKGGAGRGSVRRLTGSIPAGGVSNGGKGGPRSRGRK